VWWGRVGKMIMNYQIILKAKKNEYATTSFSRRSAQFGQLVLKLKLAHYVPRQAFPAPGFLDNRHMMVVRLSVLSTGHLYPSSQNNNPCTECIPEP
jgi:hypothetical protein